jgi:8-oxo-dGTP pyrophosphatase MutT (NUDIX family)
VTLERALAHPQVRLLADSLRDRPGVPTSSHGIGMWAAVAVIIRARGTNAEMLFIRRVERAEDRWSGQIAFPGGREEPTDGSLQRTAVRETWEEVGVDLAASAQCIGALDDVAPRTPVLPPIAVRPFVFAAPSELPLQLSHEVADAFWIPVDALSDGALRVETDVTTPAGPIRVPAIVHADRVIWGMTYRAIEQIIERLAPGQAGDLG